MKKTHLVIGASAAGIGAVSKLKELDPFSEIICVTAEKENPYNKCLLSSYLGNKKQESQVYTKTSDYFLSNSIELLQGKKVVKILPNENRVKLDDGQILSYDNLFLSLGAKPNSTEIPGINLEGIFNFYTLNDANQFINYLKTNNIENIAVVGAGLTGIECADALSSLGYKVTLIEKNTRLLNRHTNLQASLFIQKLAEVNNIKILLNESVLAFNGKNKVEQITLESGEKIKSEVVILALGVKPNSQLAIDAGIESINGFVKVSQDLKTNFHNIWAGGDMCMVKDFISNKYIPNSTWPDAVIQGMSAACNMVGQSKTYQGAIPVANSHFFGKKFFSYGDLNNLDNSELIINQDSNNCFIFELDNEKRLKSFILLGVHKNLGLIRKFLIAQEAVDPKHLLT